MADRVTQVMIKECANDKRYNANGKAVTGVDHMETYVKVRLLSRLADANTGLPVFLMNSLVSDG